ncbi:unnamed protein product [Calypogeia fissa]
MPTNSAAWLVAEKAKPLEVRPALYTPPGENEIVIKNKAVAINPIDWIIQDLALFSFSYPTILGRDVAGEVVEVHSSVTRYRLGDRVVGHAAGLASRRDCEFAFQEYTVLRTNISSPIPPFISFEAASVIPLGFSTAACGLYQKTYLELEFPSVNPSPNGRVLLVWGGASSVGSNGIQLGVSSGYEVITTASTKNFDFVRNLGASQVFDYKSSTIVADLVEAMKGKTIAGVLDCITLHGAVEFCAEVLAKSEGKGHKKFISTVRGGAEEMAGGVKTKWIIASNIITDLEVSQAVYVDYLPKALAEGKFVPAPEPLVVGKGLHSIQDGLEVAKKGMSAKKVVITL